MDENRGCAAPTATTLGLPDISSPPDSESLLSEDSRPGSANSQHSPAVLSTTNQGAAHSLGDLTFSSMDTSDLDSSRARAEIEGLNERLKLLESSMYKPPEDSFAPNITSSPKRIADEEESALDEAGENLNLSVASSTHNEEERDEDSEQEQELSHHSSFDSEVADLPGDLNSDTDRVP